jgi:hypothetical protein
MACMTAPNPGPPSAAMVLACMLYACCIHACMGVACIRHVALLAESWGTLHGHCLLHTISRSELYILRRYRHARSYVLHTCDRCPCVQDACGSLFQQAICGQAAAYAFTPDGVPQCTRTRSLTAACGHHITIFTQLSHSCTPRVSTRPCIFSTIADDAVGTVRFIGEAVHGKIEGKKRVGVELSTVR